MNPPQRRLLCPMALLLLLACGTAVSASAEVYVSGTADKIVLQAKNATIGEVLEAVRSTLKLRAELAGSTARQFTGAYAGSLRRVLSRLLDGESFIISSTPDGVNIVILGPRGTVPRAVPVRPGAIANADNNPVQGWDPPAPAHDANKPVRLAAEDNGKSCPPGWDAAMKPLIPPLRSVLSMRLSRGRTRTTVIHSRAGTRRRLLMTRTSRCGWLRRMTWKLIHFRVGIRRRPSLIPPPRSVLSMRLSRRRTRTTIIHSRAGTRRAAPLRKSRCGCETWKLIHSGLGSAAAQANSAAGRAVDGLSEAEERHIHSRAGTRRRLQPMLAWL